MKKKVCAYVRVSSSSKAQEHSYEFQKAYWTEELSSNNEYDFIGVYADKGISGKETSRRPQFIKMITAAKNGQIDIIFCKSVQRFARNTSELLDHVRELRTKDNANNTMQRILIQQLFLCNYIKKFKKKLLEDIR